jgi:hypothetical protein
VSFGKAIVPALVFSTFLATAAFAAAKTEDRVWITRPDGSLQCDEKTAGTPQDPVVVAKEQLTKKGVHVIDAKKSNDGRIRAQVCGISTGNETRFLIPKSELAKAKSLGFEASK